MEQSNHRLTMPQKQIVNAILDFYFDNLRMPSYRELGANLKLSRHTSKFHSDAIHKKGLLKQRYKIRPGTLRAMKDGYCLCKQMELWFTNNDRFEIRT